MTRAKPSSQRANLQLAHELRLPLDTVTQAIAVLAKRRAGKSYFGRRLAEQLHYAGQQVVIVDPKGDWWGILSSRDGKGAGLPIVIFGGERGHVPLEPSGGDLVAKLVVEERVSALLDLSLFRKHELATFMATFLEALYRLKAQERFRTPLMLIIDEADAVAPQKPQPNEARMLGAAEDIVRRGGQRGLGCTLITQRSAVLAKNVLTQVQIMVALRTISPQDLAAISAWIDVHGSPEQRKTLMDSLPSLPVGDAWVWSPGWPSDAGIFQRIHTLPIETFDSGATPKPGEKRTAPKQVADVDLDAVRAQMAATLERAKADDPRELRKRIGQLEQELHAAVSRAEHAPPERIEVEKPILGDADRRSLERVATAAEAVSARVRELIQLLEHMPRSKATATTAPPRRTSTLSSRIAAPPKPNGGVQAIGEGERKILIATAQHSDGVTREQLSILTGYKRSTRDAYVQRLRGKQLLNESAGRLLASDAGIRELGSDYEPLPTGAALLQHWLRQLPEGERVLLELVSVEFPQSVSRDSLTEASQYKRSTRDAYLQRLTARRLIQSTREGVVASKDLFD